MNLRGRFFAALLLEKHVVIGVGIKRWVEINEVHRLAGNVVLQHLQVVPEIECVDPIHILGIVSELPR